LKVLREARDSLRAFAQMIGRPLLDYQTQALSLETRTTVIVAPRQTGKSYSFADLALWWAFRRPNQLVLIVSAGEEASKRLLAQIVEFAQVPILKGSVLNESASIVTLSNGSQIRSVPSSERQIRGWTVDLLLVDEAAFVGQDVLLGAALPTTIARREARVVLCSTPWDMTSAFYRFALQGDEADSGVRTFRWRRLDCPWITQEAVEQARKTLSPARFRAEFEGEFVGTSDALFPLDEIRACTAAYNLLSPTEARGEEVVAGVDWGRAFDRHALVCVGVLEDFSRNEHPHLFIPYLDTSQRTYTEMVESVVSVVGERQRRTITLSSPFYSRPIVESMGNGWTLHETAATLPWKAVKEERGFRVRALVTETNGVGAMPSEELRRRLGRRVIPIHSSQRSKEDGYSRLRALLSDRRIVLPDSLELTRQLAGITYSASPSGGIHIAAADEATHDDLADALTLALAAVPVDIVAHREPADEAGEIEWIETEGGVSVPRNPRPHKSGAFRRASQRVVTW
jgi:hypothetical protein